MTNTHPPDTPVSSSPIPSNGSALRETARKTHAVLVPVFLQVEVPADDELEAEVAAAAAVRSISEIQAGDATVSFRSLIGPLVDRASASLS